MGSSAEPGGIKGQIKRLVRKMIAWYVVPTVEDIAVTKAHEQMQPVHFRVEAIEDRFGDVDALKAINVNLELLKAEVRGLEELIEGLGMSIAPGAGIAAAGDRLAELRERLNAVERRMRSGTVAPAAPSPSQPASTPAPSQDAPASASIDYVGFERRFRGDPELIAVTLKERYLDTLSENPPVLDIGCGRGELLQVLSERGVEAAGVDLDHGMVVEAQERGLKVVEADALSYLEGCAPSSLGAVIAIHVFEHLELDYLVRLLETIADRLKPGGLLIAETPNPASLIVLGNSYALDPTHVRPLHPSLLTFLCESAGFRDVQLRFYSPAEGYHLPRIPSDDTPDWAAKVDEGFKKLNDVLFGPQEYAVVASTPSG